MQFANRQMKVVVTVCLHASALALFPPTCRFAAATTTKREPWAIAVCYSKVVATVCLHASTLTHFSLQLVDLQHTQKENTGQQQYAYGLNAQTFVYSGHLFNLFLQITDCTGIGSYLHADPKQRYQTCTYTAWGVKHVCTAWAATF